jgi:hypothetical protein
MNVAHGLAAVSAGVEDDPVARIGDTLGDRDLMRMGREVGQQAVSGRHELSQIGVVDSRDNEHVYGGLRIDIAEGDRPLRARNYRCWYLGGRDGAKQAVWHALDLNVCPACDAADIYGVTTANPRCTTPLVQRPRQFLASVAQGLVMRGRCCEGIGCGCGGSADREASGTDE